MHSIMMIGGGLLLLGTFIVAGHLLGGDRRARTRAVVLFIPAWFVAAAVNLYIGVTQAGFTVMQELPFFILVFGVPAGVALGIRWYLQRRA